MIRNDLIQAGIVSQLLADTALTSFLTTAGATGEIREAQFQGREFLYPNVRVELGTQTEDGDPPCFSGLPFTIYCHSENDSSQEANELAGLVNDALIRKVFTGTGFRSGIIQADGAISAIRATERIWQAVNQYITNIYGGFDWQPSS